MKEDPGVSKAQAWGCPRASPSPSTIISSSFSMLYFYHFICYVLCLERLALYFLVCFSLLAVHNKLDPSLLCLGEKHAPLHPRKQHRFACLSSCVCSLSFHSCCHAQLLVFMLIFLRAFIQVVTTGTLLSFHAYLVQRVGLLH